MAKSIRIIAVPYHMSKERLGLGCGPEAFLEAGAEKTLRSAGREVSCEIVQQREAFSNETDFLLALHQKIAAHVRAALSHNQFPLILCGNCHASIGALGGLDGKELGLIWFDAHGDFNTPATSPSGYFDGMALAVIAGLCHSQFVRNANDNLPLPATHIVHLGGRDFDPGELDNFRDRGLRLIPAEQIEQIGINEAIKHARERLATTISAVHLHLDIDVLNSQDYPANEFPAAGRMPLEDLMLAIELIAKNFTVQAATLSAYDPAYDPDGKTLRAGLRLMETMARSTD
jgi:arginase